MHTTQTTASEAGLRLSGPDRRRQLLGAALEIFAAKGFHRASMDEIADAAGVTKPVVYQHFRSKRALFHALVVDIGEQLEQAIRTSTDAAADPRAQAVAGFTAYLRFVSRHPAAFWVLFGSEARRDPEFAEAVDGVEDALAETIAPLISAGLDADHRSIVAFALVGMAEGTTRGWLRRLRGRQGLPAEPEALAEEADRVAEWVASLAWSGLRGL
jgi:AcrR family transcriptional regulator